MLADALCGGLAEFVTVPARNLVDKPASLSFEEAACLPTAWLTAYRMLQVRAGVRPGHWARMRSSRPASGCPTGWTR
jgi:NADPH:quinone reductase-like Zn-dependent oxidoreductase